MTTIIFHRADVHRIVVGTREMPFTLEQVVPWGRSFDEYCRMFALADHDLKRSLLGCADGPAAFNAGWTRRSGQIVSCDPLYGFSLPEIELRIAATFTTILDQTRNNLAAFIWSPDIPDVPALGARRMAAMREFLDDLPSGRQEGRYLRGALPALPFPDRKFDLALCSHFLFLYESLGALFHRQSVDELVRVAREVRIFPLVQLDGQRSPYVHDVMEQLNRRGCAAEIVPVAYEFQRGATEMLRISAN